MFTTKFFPGTFLGIYNYVTGQFMFDKFETNKWSYIWFVMNIQIIISLIIIIIIRLSVSLKKAPSSSRMKQGASCTQNISGLLAPSRKLWYGNPSLQITYVVFAVITAVYNRLSRKSDQLFLLRSGWPLHPQKGHHIKELCRTKCADGRGWSYSGWCWFKYCISTLVAEGIPKKVKVMFIYNSLSHTVSQWDLQTHNCNSSTLGTCSLTSWAFKTWLTWHPSIESKVSKYSARIKPPLQWHQPTKLFPQLYSPDIHCIMNIMSPMGFSAQGPFRLGFTVLRHA